MNILRLVMIVAAIVYCCQHVNSQIPGIWGAKEYSKDVSLFRAKRFLITDVLKASNVVTKFSIDALAASSSGEVTSLAYECQEQNLQGMVLAFYGQYWNDAGVVYQGYGFKNLERDKALQLMNLVTKALEDNDAFLRTNYDNNTLSFSFDDVTIMISASSFPKIRLFWKTFDAEWEMLAFKRTKRRLERKMSEKK